jgi:endonuclease/exonuclease/phosphatase family metal-dependent hydrolase
MSAVRTRCLVVSPKHRCVGLIGLILLTLAPATVQATANEPSRPLRLVTYNVLHGGPASGFMLDDTQLDVRLDMAVRELEALQPDIIALQEVSQSRQYGDVPGRLAGRLGFHIAFAPATERLFGFWPLDKLVVGLLGFKEGSAVLSRFPITASQVHDLPRCQRWLDPRILLQATVSTPWGPVHIFSTHTARQDQCQVKRVGERVTATVREHPTGAPVLVMGDFNSPDTSPVLTAFREEARFVDVFRSVNPDDPGFTVWQQITAPRPTVFRRVDYIFVVNGQGSTTAAVRSSRVVLDQPGRLPEGRMLWPSDHYGVFAELNIVPAAGATVR